MEALKELNYSYLPRHKSSTSKNNCLVLIIAGDISNPTTVDYIEGIREKLSQSGKRAVIALSDYKSDEEISFLQVAKENSFSGIFLINAVETPRLIEMINSIRAPVILVNRYLRSLECDLVKIDNYRCGYLATQYLIQHGHKRIAHLAGPTDSITCQDRTRGFQEAMVQVEFPILPEAIYYSNRNYFDCGKQFGQQIAQMPEEERFTAIYSTNSLMASGIIEGLAINNLIVPNHISLVCSDDSERFFHKNTTLTTVGYNPYTLGIAAVELFVERLKNPKGLPKHIVYSPKITEGESVRTLVPED